MDPALHSTPPVRALPDAGTLTFLFTDVEGSSALWEQHEATMRAVAARHDALLDTLIAKHSGTRVRERGEGDSLFAVFVDPTQAVAAALAMTHAVLAEPWPEETPLRVRMGLHTGSAQLRAGDYYGPVVNRCARLRGLGHGGQVLLSAATAALVRAALPAGASLRPLGAHPLRGLSTPEEVYQLCHPDLPGEFPPLLSPQAPRHNLPLALTALIGRETEQGEVLALLAQARLVTLVGSGGVGKTRLALAVAAELVDHYPDGVWLVELAALAEDRLVSQTVLETLGTREEPGRPLLATLTEHLQDKRLLLLLDNCEHLIAACATLAEAVLRRCPGVRVLATSREALEVAGEQRYRVPSLPVPDLAHLPPPAQLAEAAAVALFLARARERRTDVVLTAHNARAVAQVCARLDGIPLALELAAARVDSLGVEGLAARLDDRFRLLTGGPRTVLPRQRTLRAALDWSYDLLTASEQLLLDRLSVFAGGWSLAAAEAICAGEEVEHWEVIDLLASLVNKSLLQTAGAEGELRYGLLETVRQYGQERLAASGALARLRDRHLTWSLALAEEAVPHLQGAADQGVWMDRLETEYDNLRAALRWARERGAAEEGLRLAGALGYFWSLRGYLGEGRGWLEGALAAGATVPAAVRALALRAAGDLAQWQGDFGRGVALLEEGLTLSRALCDAHGIAATLGGLAFVLERQGDYPRATSVAEEALALSRALGDRAGMAAALSHLAVVAGSRGEYKRSTALHEESLALWREVGSPPREVGYTLDYLAWMLTWRGAYQRAATLAEEALAGWRGAGSEVGIGWALMILGWSLLTLGEEGRATALFEESLALVSESGHFWGLPWAFTMLGWAAYRRGEHERAAVLQEQALAHFRHVHYPWGVAWVLSSLGCVLQAGGDHLRAAACLAEGLALGREIGTQGFQAEALEAMAWLAVAEGQPERAARLGGTAEALREELGAALHPVLHVGHERAVLAMRAALDEAAFAVAWAEGRVLSLEEAVTLALADTDAVRHGP
jgi:predicted ATPase/class 3 adenylate cyclase